MKVVRCDDVIELLLVDPLADPLPDPAAERHVRTCLRCRGARLEHRRVARALAELREQRAAFDDDEIDDAVAELEDALARRDRALLAHLRRRRVAYLGAGLAAATAGAASAVVLGGRRRSGGRLAG